MSSRNNSLEVSHLFWLTTVKWHLPEGFFLWSRTRSNHWALSRCKCKTFSWFLWLLFLNGAMQSAEGHCISGAAHGCLPNMGAMQPPQKNPARHGKATTVMAQVHSALGREHVEKMGTTIELSMVCICSKGIRCKSIWYDPRICLLYRRSSIFTMDWLIKI